MKIGVVTVTFNSEQVLQDFLSSLRGQTHSDYRLYVVDNASTDGSIDYLMKHMPPRSALLRNAENVGFAAATNQGVRDAMEDGCDAILAINNDVIFGPDLRERLVNGLCRHRCAM